VRDLVTVNELDDAAALERRGRHADQILTFELVRRGIRGQVDRLDLEKARDLIVRHSGFANWEAFLESIGADPPPQAPKRPAKDYEQAAGDFVNAYEGDAAALEQINRDYGRSFSFDDLKVEIWRRVYAFRQRAFQGPNNYLKLGEAQSVVSQDAGFGSWAALMQALAACVSPQGPPYKIDPKANRIGPARRMTDADWEELIRVAIERRAAGIAANGMMTDAVLGRIADLDHVTQLNLGGSRELTDDGLLHLRKMPSLEYLVLNEYPGGKLTDRGLEVLHHLRISAPSR
jgi:hypothetical protein